MSKNCVIIVGFSGITPAFVRCARICYNLIMLQRVLRGLEIAAALVILALMANYSAPSLTDKTEKVRAFTRQIEFNYVAWMADAALVKLRSASVGAPYAFDHAAQKQIVAEYLRVTQFIIDKERSLEQIYADATIVDKEGASQATRAELANLYARQTELAPLAESILQEQVSQIIVEIGLAPAGQPTPSVWYHSTPLPMALIVSPRDHIEQVANISVETNLAIDEQAALENRVDAGLNTSSLVVNIGGVGVYPTMIMRSADMNWLTTVIAHEWIHNYLTLHPLGVLYMETPELRTMNETAASIAGDEIGALVLKRFYPEIAAAAHLNSGLIFTSFDPFLSGDFRRSAFDFREAMRETRVTADALLVQGKIKEAEAYMEGRRAVFLENGYVIRKINQAYFAFYGAYANTPGGAAGEDPVGPAVRALRAQSASLADFIKAISWMTSFEQLQEAVKK